MKHLVNILLAALILLGLALILAWKLEGKEINLALVVQLLCAGATLPRIWSKIWKKLE